MILDIEIALARNFHWSLRDIDETDVDSLLPFVARLGQPAESKLKTKRVFCDEVDWL